jgi:phosphate starvation-inducible PhoH-like protein
LLGDADCHLRRLREALGVEVVARGEQLHLDGAQAAVERAVRAIEGMLRLVRKGQYLEAGDVERILESVQESQAAAPEAAARSHHAGHRAGAHHRPDELLAGRVRPQTPGQRQYVEAMQRHDVVFAIGPAGTGKTYLAVATAVEYLARGTINRLILVRPAVEAGEHLGFLPGDLREKVNPYLRPLYDALHDLLTAHQVARFMQQDVIEVAPLAFMRGRTLNNAFVILDEAQNTTPKQMKMFLTRLGNHARAVITGDVTQADLPEGALSGLGHAWEILHGIEGVAFVRLERTDIVRHPLVQRIVDAYEAQETDEQGRR